MNNKDAKSSLMNSKYFVPSIQLESRHMSSWDMFATWFGANANNGTWFIGGLIAACGFWGGFWNLVIASIISYLFLSLIGFMGYKTGMSTMVLARATFGIRGSIIPSFLNLTIFIGWTAVNTFIAATSLTYIFHSFLGWPVYNQSGGTFSLTIGIIIMGILHILSSLAGQKSIQWVERIGIILVILFVIWETIAIFSHVSLLDVTNWHLSPNETMKNGVAIDTLAAFNLSWVIAAADFTRFTKKNSTATIASFWGALSGAVSFALIGLVATITVAIKTGTYNPNNSDPSNIANALGLGMLAMIVIILTSTTANADNIQAGGSALNNVFPKLNLKKAVIIIAVLSTLATFIPVIVNNFAETFTDFLNYMAMAIGPMIALMIINFYINNHKNYSITALNNKNSKFWYTNGFNWMTIGLWILGIILYLIISQIPMIQNTIGATFLVMIIIGIMYLLLNKRFKNI